MPNHTIEESIGDLFAVYRQHPLRLMREIGIQTRLANLIQGKLEEPFCRARIVKSKRKDYVSTDTVERVQMEVCIEVKDYRSLEASDIVVMRPSGTQAVSLKLYGNGHLDIVSKISAQDLAAVIEVKAACSADLRERHKFRLDVAKLLALATRIDAKGWVVPQMHMVLVDKSLSVREHKHSNKQPEHDWHTENDDDVQTWTDRGQEMFWVNSPRIQLLETEPDDGPFVHVWTLEHTASGSVGDRVMHRYGVTA